MDMLNDKIKTAAVVEGKKLARGIFSLRGNHSEAHITETELATMLSLAFEHGVKAVIFGLTAKEAA